MSISFLLKNSLPIAEQLRVARCFRTVAAAGNHLGRQLVMLRAPSASNFLNLGREKPTFQRTSLKGS